MCLTEILNFKPLIDETMEIDMTRVVWSASPTIKLRLLLHEMETSAQACLGQTSQTDKNGSRLQF